MPTTINFKQGLDFPRGRPVAFLNNNGISSAAFWNFAYDLRGRDYRTPIAVSPGGTGNLVSYNMAYDTFGYLVVNANLIGAGSYSGTGSNGIVMAPSQGPSGTLSSGNTSMQVVLSTALPASVRVNQLANRGDGKGYIIRIIGNSAGGSGKIEERRIVSNSSGTTPTIVLDEALTFTPALNDRYEILSGRVYMLASGSTAAGSWRFFDMATSSVSGNLSNTNQPSVSNIAGISPQFIALDEAYVPYNRNPGEGFLVGAATYDAGSTNWVKSCLTATATAAGTITGQSSAGDASVLANEYRNFQIRIVEDTGTPTAVGQRRRITSHTAGASAVYTLASNWTVTPSTTAKFVIENDNDKIIVWAPSLTSTYNWNITAGTWDTTTWAARATAHTTGSAHQAFSIVPDVNKYARQSFIFSPRINATTIYDIFDIAGGATGAWTNAITPPTISLSASTVVTGAQVPWTQEGRYYYYQLFLNPSPASGIIMRFDMKNQTTEAYCTEAMPVASFSLSGMGNGGISNYYMDGSTYVSSVFFIRSNEYRQLCQYPILS